MPKKGPCEFLCVGAVQMCLHLHGCVVCWKCCEDFRVFDAADKEAILRTQEK